MRAIYRSPLVYRYRTGRRRIKISAKGIESELFAPRVSAFIAVTTYFIIFLGRKPPQESFSSFAFKFRFSTAKTSVGSVLWWSVNFARKVFVFV